MAGKEKNIKGNVAFKKDIILSVINLAAKEIAGVSSIVERHGNVLALWFNKNYQNGVRLSYQKEKISVDVYINVFFGFNVSEIAYRVQENIKNSITSMINVNLDRINVHVLGVDFASDNSF